MNRANQTQGDIDHTLSVPNLKEVESILLGRTLILKAEINGVAMWAVPKLTEWTTSMSYLLNTLEASHER